MMGSIKTRSKDFEKGLAGEVSFRNLIGESITSLATKNENIYSHIDLFARFGIDVKTIKSQDEHGNSTYHWVELKNVQGKKGWLYGDHAFIAFETKMFWLIVPTLELQEFIKENTIKSKRYKVPYHLYTREGRDDLMVMVPTVDLCSMGFMLRKNAIVDASTDKG